MKIVPLTVSDHIDQINQIGNELSTIWLALGNTTDIIDEYLVDIREALAGTAFRLREVSRAIQDAQSVSQEGGAA